MAKSLDPHNPLSRYFGGKPEVHRLTAAFSSSMVPARLLTKRGGSMSKRYWPCQCGMVCWCCRLAELREQREAAVGRGDRDEVANIDAELAGMGLLPANDNQVQPG
jgi:hypothetical protein